MRRAALLGAAASVALGVTLGLIGCGDAPSIPTTPRALGSPPAAAPQAIEGVVSMNGLPVTAVAPGTPYAFLVGGHLYGAPRNRRSVFSSSTLLGNLDRLNASGADLFVSLGDAIMYPLPTHYSAFRSGLLERLEMPLLNAVGNHDVAQRDLYLAEFPGPTWYAFRRGAVLHVVLDTEVDPGAIAGEQLAWLLPLLDAAREDAAVASAALYGHKLIWTDGRPEVALLLEHVNNPLGYRSAGEFTRDVLPTLRALAARKQVVFFSGDVGVEPHSPPFFYVQEPGLDLHWVATGLGDTADDVLCRVDVDEHGRMALSLLHLNGGPEPPVAELGLAWLQAWVARL